LPLETVIDDEVHHRAIILLKLVNVLSIPAKL
jgi:hypothetical protein